MTDERRSSRDHGALTETDSNSNRQLSLSDLDLTFRQVVITTARVLTAPAFALTTSVPAF